MTERREKPAKPHEWKVGDWAWFDPPPAYTQKARAFRVMEIGDDYRTLWGLDGRDDCGVLAERCTPIPADRDRLQAEVERLRGIVAECVKAMTWWGQQEDGIPEECWLSFDRATAAIAEQAKEERT